MRESSKRNYGGSVDANSYAETSGCRNAEISVLASPRLMSLSLLNDKFIGDVSAIQVIVNRTKPLHTTSVN